MVLSFRLPFSLSTVSTERSMRLLKTITLYKMFGNWFKLSFRFSDFKEILHVLFGYQDKNYASKGKFQVNPKREDYCS